MARGVEPTALTAPRQLGPTTRSTMPSVPRIIRAIPATITTLPDPVPVIARLNWQTGSSRWDEDAQAWALATSPTHAGSPAAVLVCWDDDGPRTDWLPHTDVRHPGAEHSGINPLPFQPPAQLRPHVRPGPPRP